MSMRDRIIRAMLERRGIPPTPVEHPYVAAQARIDAQQRAENALSNAGGDPAAAMQKAQDTINWYSQREPLSDRNAQFMGKMMRHQDEVIDRLQNPAAFADRWWPE